LPGGSVTYTVEVNSPEVIPYGTVIFTMDGLPIGMATLDGTGNGTLVTAAPAAVGEYEIGAYYLGNTAFEASVADPVTLTVQMGVTQTSVKFAHEPEKTSITALPYQDVTFNASVVGDLGVPQGWVTFYDNGSPLATVALDNEAKASYTDQLPIGTHTIT